MAAIAASPMPRLDIAGVMKSGHRHGVGVLPVAIRRLIVLATLMLAVAGLVSGYVVVSGLLSAPEAGAVTTVQSGQTLWDIARATGSADISRTVSEIVELNDLDGSTVQAGQILILPAH